LVNIETRKIPFNSNDRFFITKRYITKYHRRY